jgi:hypothetical protein
MILLLNHFEIVPVMPEVVKNPTERQKTQIFILLRPYPTG